MRIKTDDKYRWRLDEFDGVVKQLGENTRSGAIDTSVQFTKQCSPRSIVVLRPPAIVSDPLRCRSSRAVNNNPGSNT